MNKRSYKYLVTLGIIYPYLSYSQVLSNTYYLVITNNLNTPVPFYCYDNQSWVGSSYKKDIINYSSLGNLPGSKSPATIKPQNKDLGTFTYKFTHFPNASLVWSSSAMGDTSRWYYIYTEDYDTTSLYCNLDNHLLIITHQGSRQVPANQTMQSSFLATSTEDPASIQDLDKKVSEAQGDILKEGLSVKVGEAPDVPVNANVPADSTIQINICIGYLNPGDSTTITFSYLPGDGSKGTCLGNQQIPIPTINLNNYN